MNTILRFSILGLLQLLSPWSQPLQADPLDNWHLRYDKDGGDLTDQTIEGIAYGNGRFVAIGHGTALASPNGTEWFSSGFPNPMDWVRSITFANGMFIAIGQAYNPDVITGYAEAISVSTNGAQWNLSYLSDSLNLSLSSVTYGNGRFVAIGHKFPSNITLASSDGTNWMQTSLSFNFQGAIAFGNGTFVVVCSDGSILNSNDGMNWAVRRRSASDGLNGVTYGNGLFVAVGGSAIPHEHGIVLTSPDGIKWTPQSPGTRYWLGDITYGEGIYVASGGNVTAGGVGEVVTSNDGVAWTPRNTGTRAAIAHITFGDGSVVASADRFIIQSDPLVASPPRIVRGPDNTRVVPGSDAVLRVLATGTSPLNYQWLREGLPIAGATNPVLSLPNLQSSDSASYAVTVGNLLNSLTSQPAQVQVLAIDPEALDHWQWRNPLPQGNNLYSIVFGNGTFVAVGEAHTILTSKNGLTWDLRETDALGRLNAVTYGDGTFVAIGSYYDRDAGDLRDIIIASQDGIHWDQQFAGPAGSLRTVAYGAHLFVAVGYPGTILTSADGTNWTTQLSDGSSYLSSVAFGNGRFVAVGRTGVAADSQELILASLDGIKWTRRGPTATGGVFWEVNFGNGAFLVRGFNALSNYSSQVITSPDGVNWTDFNLGVTSHRLGNISVANDLFIGVSSETNAIYTSPDAVNWIEHGPTPFQSPNAIAYGNGRYVAVGSDANSMPNSGFIFSSSDLAEWTNHLTGVTGDLRDLAYGNGMYIAVGNGVVLRSTNGTVWATNSTQIAAELYGIAYGHGLFAAVGMTLDDNSIGHGIVLTSADGLSWRTNGANLPISQAIVFANGLFVAVGEAGAILGSPDGQTWLVQDSPATNALQSVSFGKGKFIATGDYGTIVTSTNGTDWKLIPPFTNLPLGAVASDEWTFVAGGGVLWSDSFAYTSDDSQNWSTHQLAPTGEYVRSMAYGDGLFVAVAASWPSGEPRGIFSSPDGMNWHQRNLPIGSGLNAARYANGTFWALGSNGTILQARSTRLPKFRPETLHRLPDGIFTSAADIGDGSDVAIEASSDLRNWSILTTLPHQTGKVQIEDTNSVNSPQRFYRARLVLP